MTWIIRGADRVDGEARCSWIDAETQAVAEAIANRDGILISSVALVKGDSRLPEARRMILENVRTYMESDVVTAVQALPAPNPCDGCTAKEGQVWTLSQFVKELPIPCDGCKDEPVQVCRCDITAVLNDEYNSLVDE